MKRIVLFRFHENQTVCRNHLELLRRYNPGTAIYGMYGGNEDVFPRVEHSLGQEFSHLYCLRGKTKTWKWLHGDLAVREWHQMIGRELDFDMLHVIEWDLLLLDSLEKLYSAVPKDSLGITGLIPLRLVSESWGWCKLSTWIPQWERLLAHSREKYMNHAEPYASLGPGLCLPKEFLDLYADSEVPALCHDEVRLPLFAQNLGLNLCDTNFYQGWFDGQDEIFFNCTNKEIELETIKRELGNPLGRRAFHPFRQILTESPAESVRASV